MEKELTTRLQTLKDKVWTAKNTGVSELKDAFVELVAIVHQALAGDPKPPPPATK